jgi:hypothetical protein
VINAIGAVFDLNNPAHVVHWHFFEMSVANVIVICLMLAVFVLAILLPFPGAARRQAARAAAGPLAPRPPGGASTPGGHTTGDAAARR